MFRSERVFVYDGHTIKISRLVLLITKVSLQKLISWKSEQTYVIEYRE